MSISIDVPTKCVCFALGISNVDRQRSYYHIPSTLVMHSKSMPLTLEVKHLNTLHTM